MKKLLFHDYFRNYMTYVAQVVGVSHTKLATEAV